MKAKTRDWKDVTGDHGTMLYLWCPGCDDLHGVEVEQSAPTAWQWDGNLESPTISPSIKCMGHKGICHSFVRNGQWEFLSDCYHSLAGTTVDLPDLPDWITHD
jgi:hypothetical protein